MRAAIAMTLLLCLAQQSGGQQTPDKITAIVGATVIDGNGGPPLQNATIVVTGATISAIGTREEVEIPDGASVIEARGKFVTPGFIDSNVHLSLYGGHTKARYESLVRYEHRQEEIVLEAAQLQLKYGVTTVRDSYGVLPPLVKVRDAIEHGEKIGSRMLVAGNIVGWGGPFSITFSLIPETELTVFQERMNDLISQGAGEDLMDISLEELRTAINGYLDKGPDFIKYGGTGHFSRPVLIGFSPEAQKIMVEETHRRGRIAETHSTSIEGLRLSVVAGIDLIQHPEIISAGEMPDDLVNLIKERNVICAMLVNTMTGAAWDRHLQAKEKAEKQLAESQGTLTGHQAHPVPRPMTSAEARRQNRSLGNSLQARRLNAKKLIEAGCIVTIGTDNYRGAAPEFARKPKPEDQDHGIGSIIAIEGLVELGMTPGQAIVAATKNGAMAYNALASYGTLEVDKSADLVILDADPLADITNIRKVHTVMKEGQVIDRARLPEAPIFYCHPDDTRTSSRNGR
jgi:imidazolonepropionase-like amidohydrolase